MLDFLRSMGLWPRKTVAHASATFTTIIADLQEIAEREESQAVAAEAAALVARQEADQANAYKLGLGKLLAGQ